MAKNLVIVESPAKAKTIKKYLGSGFEVLACNGHVQDLPKSSLGIDVENDFEPHYITIRGKGDLLSKLRKEAKKAEKIYLATDPDREGEAISWHLMDVLGLDKANTQRISFNEITKNAVKNSLKAARELDMPLVDAQQARRALDRIVGYEISPLLWKKIKKGLSAGRVQSAALKLLADREAEIAAFNSEEFWTVEGEAALPSGSLTVRLTAIDGEKPALSDAETAEAVKQALNGAAALLSDFKRGKRVRKGPDAFTTSTLQQEASRRLNFSPQKTMSIAQELYEGVELPKLGTVALITYLRTDSTRVSEEAAAAAAEYITANYGENYLGKAEAAPKKEGRIQDAHEAIRPTYTDYVPKSLSGALSSDQYKLYKLIWERFIASRMADAEYETYTAEFTAKADKTYSLTASGSRRSFAGFQKLYKDDDDTAESYQAAEDLKPGVGAELRAVEAEQHFTQPPAHFTEATLVKALEDNGIGRPSTYAPVITTLYKRYYMVKEKKNLLVTELGGAVNQTMTEYFPELSDLGFTAQMEEELDEVAEGSLPWKEVLRGFYKDFEPCVKQAMETMEHLTVEDPLTDEICELCGRRMVLKIGKYGKFFACPGFPECRGTKPYYEKTGVSCPNCGAAVQLRKSKAGRAYYCCEKTGECDFISWELPTEKTCPNCGERLYKRNGRGAQLFCKKEGCGYTEKASDNE